MSDDEKIDDPKSVSVDLSAKAEASVKAEIKGEMPTSVMGRLGNALADVVSPLTEGMGLVGDNIRMHREDLAAKRVQGALEKINAQGLEITPPPLKFMIPYLEKVSIEDEDDPTLNELWEGLLVTASTECENAHPSYIQILSELNSHDAQFLMRFANINFNENFFLNVRTLQVENSHVLHDIFDRISYQKSQCKMTLDNEDELIESQQSLFSRVEQIDSRFVPILLRVPRSVEKMYGHTEIFQTGYENNFIQSENLARQGLTKSDAIYIRPISMSHLPKLESCEIQITFASLTNLGANFLSACKHDRISSKHIGS